jgi:hypothetical protein
MLGSCCRRVRAKHVGSGYFALFSFCGFDKAISITIDDDLEQNRSAANGAVFRILLTSTGAWVYADPLLGKTVRTLVRCLGI